jgi:hypothetical protein
VPDLNQGRLDRSQVLGIYFVLEGLISVQHLKWMGGTQQHQEKRQLAKKKPATIPRRGHVYHPVERILPG